METRIHFIIAILATVCTIGNVSAQTADSDIVRLTLGKDFHKLHPILDSLKL